MSASKRARFAERKAEIVRMNALGYSGVTIAKRFDMHPTSISHALTRAGITPTDTRRSFMEEVFDDLSKRRAAIEILKNDAGHTAHKQLTIRARILTQQGVIDKELGQSFRAALLWGIRHRKASISTSYWLWDRIINPIRNALKAADLPEKRLFFSFSGNPWNTDTFTSLETFITDRYRERGPKENFGFSRKVVAIGFSKDDIGERVRNYPDVLTVTHAADSLIAYVVPRTFTRIAKVRETFKALGFKVLDFTIRNPWEKDDVLLPVVREVRETKKGLPLLKSINFNGVFRMPNDPATCDTIKFRETKPEFVLTVARGRQDCTCTRSAAGSRCYRHHRPRKGRCSGSQPDRGCQGNPRGKDQDDPCSTGRRVGRFHAEQGQRLEGPHPGCPGSPGSP